MENEVKVTNFIHDIIDSDLCADPSLKIHTRWQVGPTPQMVSGFRCTLATQPTFVLA